ncbi:hypothetical protein ACIOJ9_29085 [Streptomyces sp. NPDC088175]|uniref:hypothetical protein n=1 Tax=unclassified Streptomyces TaxID=2593676 RepID=UPI0038258B0D
MGLFKKKESTAPSAPYTYPAPAPGSHIPDQTPPPVDAHLRPVGSTVPDQRPKWLREQDDENRTKKRK